MLDLFNKCLIMKKMSTMVTNMCQPCVKNSSWENEYLVNQQMVHETCI